MCTKYLLNSQISILGCNRCTVEFQVSTSRRKGITYLINSFKMYFIVSSIWCWLKIRIYVLTLNWFIYCRIYCDNNDKNRLRFCMKKKTSQVILILQYMDVNTPISTLIKLCWNCSYHFKCNKSCVLSKISIFYS